MEIFPADGAAFRLRPPAVALFLVVEEEEGEEGVLLFLVRFEFLVVVVVDASAEGALLEALAPATAAGNPSVLLPGLLFCFFVSDDALLDDDVFAFLLDTFLEEATGRNPGRFFRPAFAAAGGISATASVVGGELLLSEGIFVLWMVRYDTLFLLKGERGLSYLII